MSDDLQHSPRRLRRQQKLVELLKSKGGPTQVALDIGTPRSHISAMALGTRGVGDKLAAKLEQHYGLPAGWFDQTEQAWPFKIDVDRFLTLDTSDREYVEDRLREVIELCELRHITKDEVQRLTVTGSSPHGKNLPPPPRFSTEVDLRTTRGNRGSRIGSQPGAVQKPGSRKGPRRAA